MTGAVFLSRVIGYLRDGFIAARFGADGNTDAFFAAFTIPDWLNYLVAGGTLSITFLPIYARHLARNDETEANRVLGIVATVMIATVGALVVIGELWAEPLIDAFFHRLEPDARAACVHMTRILLPAQLFFFAGGLASATLFARGKFAAAALAPLLYNCGIIAGGALLGGPLGREGLVWGALAGAALGPFLVPAFAAVRAGARLKPSFAVADPAFREWVKLSLPLMIGVSLVSADDWIIRYFAGAEAGAITRITFAKRLVAVPIAVAGQAIGQASMPFFARLFAEGKRQELAETFAATLRGAAVLALLASAWMVALAAPIIEIFFVRGRFTVEDVPETATYLVIFAAAVPLWSLQGLAARVFYAAGNTLTPMFAGTAITLASLPVYTLLYRALGSPGLALASGLGILAHTATMLVLAPRVLSEVRSVAPKAARGIAAGAVLAALAGAATWATAQTLPNGSFVRATAGSLVFGSCVLLGAGPLGVEEPKRLLGRLLRRWR